MSIKVSIVEDNEGIRESLVVLIDGSPGFHCVSSFENAERAIKNIPNDKPDVVLMDINLPNMSGVDCVRELKAKMPELQIIMLTVHEDSDLVFKSLSAGASGYLVKRSPPVKILEAIEEVQRGGSPMSSQIARMVVQQFRDAHLSKNETETLSKREMEVLSLLAKGFRYKEIADTLFISAETVRSHLRSVYEKLHVRGKTEAVLKFLSK